MAGPTQGQRALLGDSRNWVRGHLEGVPSERRGADSVAQRENRGLERGGDQELEGLKAKVAANICPEKLARAARVKLAKLGVVLLALGCHQLDPQTQQAADLFKCSAHVLEPYAGSVFDTAKLVRDIAQGSANLESALMSVGLVAEEIAKVRADLDACAAPPAVAPPPAPGDKVL